MTLHWIHYKMLFDIVSIFSLFSSLRFLLFYAISVRTIETFLGSNMLVTRVQLNLLFIFCFTCNSAFTSGDTVSVCDHRWFSFLQLLTNILGNFPCTWLFPSILYFCYMRRIFKSSFHSVAENIRWRKDEGATNGVGRREMCGILKWWRACWWHQFSVL